MKAPDQYHLYGGYVTRSTGPQMLLEELGLNYRLTEIDIFKGEHRHPDYLAINPAGFLPAMITPEGNSLHEASAIMLYLCDRHGGQDLAPQADDPARGRFLTWFFFLSNDIEPHMKRYFYPERFAPSPDQEPAIKEHARRMAMDRWQFLDQYLRENGPFLCGDRFTMADINLANWAAYGLSEPRSILDVSPSVNALFERIMERPACAPVLNNILENFTSEYR